MRRLPRDLSGANQYPALAAQPSPRLVGKERYPTRTNRNEALVPGYAKALLVSHRPEVRGLVGWSDVKGWMDKCIAVGRWTLDLEQRFSTAGAQIVPRTVAGSRER